VRVVSMARSGDMRWGRNGKVFSAERLEEEAEERVSLLVVEYERLVTGCEHGLTEGLWFRYES
jgi:hypothetical protein